MRLGGKLLAVVLAAASTLLLVVAVSAAIGGAQLRGLQDVEGRLIPKLELGPALDAEFQRMRLSLQDAASAQEASSLEAAAEARQRLFDLIGGAGAALRPEQAAALRWALGEYYTQGRTVAKRLIAGETGEQLVDAMQELQKSQKHAAALIESTTRLKPNELEVAFGAVASDTRRAERWRLWIGAAGLLAIGVLSAWIGRQLLGGLKQVSAGLGRFSTGDFALPIALQSRDELGTLARDANAMAASLRALDEQRKRSDWLTAGSSGLWDELRGELEPEPLSLRALRFLAERVQAQAGAVYLVRGELLELAATFAWPGEPQGAPATLPRQLRLGEGLVGEAARGTSMLVLSGLAAAQLKLSSSLVEAEPRTLVLLPLEHDSGNIGVIELLLLGELTADARELLESVGRQLAITLLAAQTYTAQRALLLRTQEQAARLGAQEEELRLNNQELQVQQQELQRINSELEAQREALRSQNVELEEAREVVQQKAEEVARVSAYKTQFLANMSHELRTPLNSMLLLSHLLAENEPGNLNAKQVEHSRTIHDAGKDLLGLINQVLDLAKIESGKQELQLEQVALTQLCSYAKRVFQPLADDKRLELSIELRPGLPASIVTDGKRLEGVLTNLLGNAIKFTERGSVRLSIGRPAPGQRFKRDDLSLEGCLELSVTDTGVGIPAEAMERVFQPFEQVEGHANRRYAGTGLGLSIARETMTLLGGELQLESRVGVGSTFRCFLPEHAPGATEARAVASDSARPSLAVEPRAERAVPDDRAQLRESEPHLLIIEDDPVVAGQLVDMVRARQFKAVVAASGKEGLELANKLVPSGIVLDVRLPDTDGWAVIERLRADARTQRIPVHFISGLDAQERGLSLGAIGYLTKPASHAEMAAMVRSLTARATAGSSQVLIVEDDAREGAALLDVLRSQGLDGALVRSAEAALQHLETVGAGCMVLDLGLPDMDGLRLLELMRDNPRIVGHPRIVVHTGRALTKKETRQLEAYSEAVILKDERSIQRLLEQMRLFVHHLSDQRPAQVAPSPILPDVSLAGARILLAEDDMRTVYALSALLQGKGADVLIAENGREAVEIATQNPDLDGVLMDIMMPEVDGYEAMRQLRRDPRFSKLPIVALTARAMKGERERCIEAGASDYLTKPVDHEKLLAAVMAWEAPRRRA